MAYHDPADRSFVPPERGIGLTYDPECGWKSNLEAEGHPPNEGIRTGRYADQLNDLYALALSCPIIMDMKDAVLQTNEFPCFQYVRRPGAVNSILWPLRRVHALDSPEFCKALDPAESKFTEKKPIVFWRGIVRGLSTFGGKKTNIKLVLNDFLQGKVSDELLEAHLQTVPRYDFVSRYFGKAGFDVGFTAAKRLQRFKKIEMIERYRRPRATHAEYLQHKYLLSIGGTDVGTSLGWQLGSNSMLLKEDYPWEVFFEGHFRADEDYLLVRQDFSDVEERVAWCEDNPDACEAMISKRHRVVPFLVDPKTLQEAMARVVRRYEEFYRRHAA